MRQLSDIGIINILRCPKCGADVCVEGTSIKCLGARAHCYDLSSSGYVNFCPPDKSHGGDSKVAVRARSTFLNMGHYAPVAKTISDICRKYVNVGGIVLDAGCGEGYYSQFIRRDGMSVFGVDMSKFATDAASKRLAKDEGGGFFFAAASVFDVPVKDNSFDAVVNIFAPCSEEEFSRVLKNEGVLIVAWAGERHLWGLKEVLYADAHVNTERADMPQDMQEICRERVNYDIELCGQQQIMSLFSMTPYYWRTSETDTKKLEKLEKLNTEVDIIISVYKKI